MRKKRNTGKNDVLRVAFIILLILALFILSFLFTSGIVYLISLCFDFVFTWKLAAGIWLVLCLVGNFTAKGSK